jgi:predicted amidohydrolase
MNLFSLQIKTSNNFELNLQKLETKILKISKNSLVLAPELCLTGYAYKRLDEAVKITNKAIKLLKKLSFDKIIVLTMTTKKNSNYFNTLHIFYQGKIVHTQSKVKLFVLDDERKYFTAGAEKDIKIIEINNIKIASLICFELRFIDLWKKVQGADIILVPAMWGKLRKQNYESLSNALAIANQCYVVASDSANSNMAKSSAIISPFGKTISDDNQKIISSKFDKKEIKKMRRYLHTGI